MRGPLVRRGWRLCRPPPKTQFQILSADAAPPPSKPKGSNASSTPPATPKAHVNQRALTPDDPNAPEKPIQGNEFTRIGLNDAPPKLFWVMLRATQEGLVPLKAWIKSALDQVVQVCLQQPDLEFVWVGDDAVDPLQQAQTLNILVGAGIKTKEEARAGLGPAAVGKYNHFHDERGLFATAAEAVSPAPHISPNSRDGKSDNETIKPGASDQIQIAQTTTNFAHACRCLKWNPIAASDALHAMKSAAGLSGGDTCTFDTVTGDVFHGGECIGNLRD